MVMLTKLRVSFCFAVLGQVVVCLGQDLDLSRKKGKSHWATSPHRTTASEPTCPIPPQLQKCQCDCSNGDCDGLQKALKPCSYVVFYGEQKDIKFFSNDEFYQARCKDQLDCSESIQCFITCCLQAKGAQFMKNLMRGIQFELLDLCHPNANPSYGQEFKEMAECNNLIWPRVYQCAVDFTWKISAAVTPKGVDIPRFCCAITTHSDCYYEASKVKCYDESQQLYFKNLILRCCGEIYRSLCSDTCYSTDPALCKSLPPVDRTGSSRPTIFEGFLNIARTLTNSSN